jgi:hypothetical protein
VLQGLLCEYIFSDEIGVGRKGDCVFYVIWTLLLTMTSKILLVCVVSLWFIWLSSEFYLSMENFSVLSIWAPFYWNVAPAWYFPPYERSDDFLRDVQILSGVVFPKRKMVSFKSVRETSASLAKMYLVTVRICQLVNTTREAFVIVTVNNESLQKCLRLHRIFNFYVSHFIVHLIYL